MRSAAAYLGMAFALLMHPPQSSRAQQPPSGDCTSLLEDLRVARGFEREGAVARRAAVACPGRVEPHEHLAMWLLVQGERDQALKELRIAVRLAPSDARIRFKATKLELQLWHERNSWWTILTVAATGLALLLWMSCRRWRWHQYYPRGWFARPFTRAELKSIPYLRLPRDTALSIFDRGQYQAFKSSGEVRRVLTDPSVLSDAGTVWHFRRAQELQVPMAAFRSADPVVNDLDVTAWVTLKIPPDRAEALSTFAGSASPVVRTRDIIERLQRALRSSLEPDLRNRDPYNLPESELRDLCFRTLESSFPAFDWHVDPLLCESATVTRELRRRAQMAGNQRAAQQLQAEHALKQDARLRQKEWEAELRAQDQRLQPSRMALAGVITAILSVVSVAADCVTLWTVTHPHLAEMANIEDQYRAAVKEFETHGPQAAELLAKLGDYDDGLAAYMASRVYYKRQDWPNMLTYCQRAYDAHVRSKTANPQNPLVLYDLACARARSGDIDGALRVLEEFVPVERTYAFGCRYQLARQILGLDRDPDLDTIKDLPRFEAIQKEIRPVLEYMESPKYIESHGSERCVAP